MRKFRRNWYAAALALCLTAGILAGCGNSDAEVMSTAIHVDSQIAEKGTLELKGTYMGTVSPNDSVDVTPMVSGTVNEVKVKVGDTVKKGDVLCQFDDTAAQFSVDSAQNSLDSAKAGKEAAKDQADLAAEQSKASVTTLEQTLSGYKKSLKTAKKQLKQLKNSKSQLKTAMDSAKTAYATAKTTYKTAQTLYVNYKTFLSTYPDCQTTAGLTAAMAAAVPDAEGNIDSTLADKAKTASALASSLSSAGVTVEYLSDSGLNALNENASDAETAYNTAASSYAEAASGITTLNNTIETLNSQIEATESSLAAAKKTQSMTAGASGDGVYDAQINAAETGVESAEYQKDLYTVTAPIGGVVEAVNVTENEMFATGMPAFTISGKQTMLVTFYVTEEVKNFLQVGDAVEADNNGTTYRGSVSSIGTAVDATKGLFKVEAQIYVNDPDAVSTGISVSLSLVTAAEKNEILIPYDAVYYENNQAYVYCIRDGKAVRVDVTTGLYNEDTITIESGIEEGDEIITSWASGLKDGAEIANEEAETEETTAQDMETGGKSEQETEETLQETEQGQE